MSDDQHANQQPQFPMDLNASDPTQVVKSATPDDHQVDDSIDNYVPPVVGPQPENTRVKDEVNPLNSMPKVNVPPVPVAPNTPPPPPVLSSDGKIASAQSPQPHPTHPHSQPQPVSMPTPPVSQPMPVQPLSIDEEMEGATPANPKSNASESLEDQNIFDLLGFNDADEEERERFLDELQQIIWEDFLANDVELLITEDEIKGLRDIQGKQVVSKDDKQEEMVVYLEKLIPDLEDIMLEKALELKGDMVRERISGMKNYFAKKPAALAKLDHAQSLIDSDQWRSAADLLNALQE